MTTLNAPLDVATPRPLALEDFRSDVLTGLRRSPKSIPCKHLYDKRGSELFDEICDLPEYYVTRCELAIMRRHADAMARRLGEGVRLIEYGSGSSVKTRLLLDHLLSPWGYVPVDVSREHLAESCRVLQREYPDLCVRAVTADFTQPLTLPPTGDDTREVIYFPGSTIGNLQHGDAQRLLLQTSRLCGEGGALLVGIDLQKDPAVVHDAYNDSRGVTAAFNLNLLRRINRELDANVDPARFQFRAVYNQRLGRVESSLVCRAQHAVTIDDQQFDFSDGEPLLTEYSHKYTVPQFERLAQEAGFRLSDVWMDEQEYFAVLLMQAEP